jgi:hypothetical protein
MGTATRYPAVPTDPYRYGWRDVRVVAPDGTETFDQVPLALVGILALGWAHNSFALHRATPLTDQNEIEKRENNLLETGNRRIALLGLWMGLMQVVSRIWVAAKSNRRWKCLMAVWAVIGVSSESPSGGSGPPEMRRS